MLTIILTPTSLYFKELSDELYEKLKESLEFEWSDKRKMFYIQDKPEKLYKILLKLAYDYDIELI